MAFVCSHKYTVHPHGVFYTKSSEGALYEDKTTGEEKKDDHVSFNGEHTYEWHIPEEHGPTKGDERCLTWIYHSHVDPAKDINTGLIGKYTDKESLLFSSLLFSSLLWSAIYVNSCDIRHWFTHAFLYFYY